MDHHGVSAHVDHDAHDSAHHSAHMSSDGVLRQRYVPGSPRARWTLRVLGAVLVVGGGLVAVAGGRAIAALGTFESPGAAELAPLVLGMFAVVFGLAALNAGFAGAQAHYLATETAGAVGVTGRAWRGDTGQAGRACPSCGAGLRAGGRFCDACGHGVG